MCGIFGVVYRGAHRSPDGQVLAQVAGILNHRGPDSCGTYADDGIGLVHTRLSLLDLSPRSNQPFWDSTGRYCLVYNGEIYNFAELKKELQAQNISFSTTSDTEVLLQGLIHYDIRVFLPRLEGMFAFAFFDRVQEKLILARDRFGIKPLYIHDGDSRFIFSSEIKAMRSYLRFEPDLLSISSYLQGFGGPTKNHTFFKNIKILPPGSIVTVCRGEPSRYESFFDVVDFWDEKHAEPAPKLDSRTAVDHVEELLLASVKKHLIADAPVGSLCSGGVDSSIVMAMAAKFHNNLAIFHANVKGPESEYEAALLLSRHLKLDLKSVDVNESDFIDEIPAVIEHYEHPFTYHPNSVPFLMVSRLVREHGVKAVLSGEGADECFLGYSHLLLEHPLMFRQRLSHHIRNCLKRIPKLRFLVAECDHATQNLIMNLQNRFEVINDNRLMRLKLQNANNNVPDRYFRTVDLLNYHLRTLLHRNDCLGMAASIEARFPFLDHPLVKCAVNMPYDFKIRFVPRLITHGQPFLRDKWVIRQVAARYLPPELSFRKKLGFPASGFERMKISSLFFEKSPIAEMFDLSSSEMKLFLESADRILLTKLLHLDVWASIYLAGVPNDRILRRLRANITLREN